MYAPQKPYKHDLITLIEGTWTTPYVRVRQGVYPIIHKKFSLPEVQHTDGIGTKGVYHWRERTFKAAVIDALAMNLNDLALMGAVPYALSDHITIPDPGHTAVLEIVRALARECRARKIAIVGGETSHHLNADGLDIGVMVSGFIREPRMNIMKPGDMLIGLRSNGLHSNGFTRVRAMFGPGEERDDFTHPTAIYLDIVLGFLKKYEVSGMMHITGGAFTKLKDLLKGADAVINVPAKLAPQPIFHELYNRGVSSVDMYTTFNCGVGFILSMPEKDAVKAVKGMRTAAIIGKVEKGSGVVKVVSAFDGHEIVL